MKGVGEMLSSEVNGLTAMLLIRIKDEIKLAWDFNKELEDLQNEFTKLSWLIAGAPDKPMTNPLMGDWLNKIKEAVYNADNLLDEWSYDVLHLQIGSSTSSSCCDMDSLIRYPISRFLMGHKVRDLRKSISGIYDVAAKLGIQPIEVAAGETYSATMPSREILDQQRSLYDQRQCVDHELMVGRDRDIGDLVELLCHPSNTSRHLTVVGIVGFPGLGKTALSKRVSNAEEVSDYFNSLVIWLVVSHSFDLIESLNKMVEILFGVASNMKNRQALILKLREKLKEKKYLLILDDVWDTTFWESFRLTLREIGGCKGSTLLVTSRNINVVARMETYSYDGTINRPSILALEELSEGDSWALFLARINDDVANSEKQLMAKRMIKNCGGVPLAIRALGDLLRRNQSIVRWREIEKSELWVKEDEYNILPSLRLSYNYLPNTALKKCFSYCAIFKEDEVIEKGRLIKMWMAHGFLQPYDQMECVGEEYFDILLNNSLFQEAERDEIGDVKTFKIHDLALSLARAVSGGQCLRLNEEYDESNEVRHLSVPSFKRQLTTTWCTKLQTIFLKDKVSSVEIQQLKKCTHLRVLKIGGFTDWNSMLELLAGTFKHLRYLEIDDYNVDETALVFPNFKLYHLQTLWIGSVTSFWNSSYPSILTGIRKLVNLRHLDYPTSLFGIPKGIGCLTALQTLPKIDLMHDPELKISELGLLGNLRGTLEIRNLKFTNCDADFLSIFSDDKLKLIERLIISWDRSFHTEIPFHNEVIEALQPKRNLKMLEIEGYFGTKFPPWLTERGFPLDNLVALTLRYCQNDNLKDLKVVNFKYLQSLVVDTCGYLRISFPEDGFHCCNLLQHLTVNGYAASFLPDLSPLTKLRTLLIAERRSSQKEELVGLSSLPCLKVLFTNQLLPADLDEHSPVCKSLRSLTLYAPDDDYNMETIQHMVALNSLALLCYKVEIVPEWMGNLTALRCLEFYEMLNLKQLPSQQAIQRLSHLETFKVVNCPLLMEDLQNKSGEWFKIAHIPHIFLD